MVVKWDDSTVENNCICMRCINLSAWITSAETQRRTELTCLRAGLKALQFVVHMWVCEYVEQWLAVSARFSPSEAWLFPSVYLFYCCPGPTTKLGGVSTAAGLHIEGDCSERLLGDGSESTP